MVSAWIGNGAVMPAARRLCTSPAGSPRLAKSPSTVGDEVAAATSGAISSLGSIQVIWSDGALDRLPELGSETRPALR